MIKVKDGVEFAVIAPAGHVILDALKYVSDIQGLDLTITSGTDGRHSGPTDPHKTGEAYDIRSHDLPADKKEHIIDIIRGVLGDRFYAFLESPGTDNEHIHIQRRRGTVFTALDLLERAPLWQTDTDL